MSPSDDPIAFARDALERHAWSDAYDALVEADRTGALSGTALEMLARANYWTGRPDATIEALERAYAAYLDEGDRAQAAMAAFRIAEQHGMRMSMPLAQGWGQKSARLAGEDPTWPVHGWLLWVQGLLLWIMEQDYAGAIQRYDEALAFAERSGDRDLAAMSLHDKGHALCLLGDVATGMPLLDECMATVVGGELDPAAAGYVYCGMIGVCSKLGDYGRASEWTAATLRWCERRSVPAFPGVCRIHRAELKLLHGDLIEAEADALAACEELPRYNFVSGQGPAFYQIGEVRRRLGDFLAAEKAYAQAEAFGRPPDPGRSLLRLAEGRVDAAAASIRQALDERGGDHCSRVRLLAAQVTIALASDDPETATSAADELDELVTVFETPSLGAMSAAARGELLLSKGDAAGSLPILRRARADWQGLDAPLEVAEVGLLLAEAYAAGGDEVAARSEARSARETFERVGARPAAERARRMLDRLALEHEPPERVTRAFLFTDIVRSTDLIGVIGDDAWEDLLTWHDRTLRSLFDAHGGDIGHPTGDGFFVAFPDARSALRCAVTVQRALAEHRRSEGFSLEVRIGVHAGEATRRGEDYGGAEVHRAARIAGLADGGEILASRSTIDEVGSEVPYTASGDASLKGFTQPVALVRVSWRDARG
ncbi:MAG TPA: adenylate/guanylate cyclase domain-containing protein [Actinomycetota bacterium]|nr:adenylate/guanylate cyclase domain-containing protein [Actinomycetota bacterium]